jgi:hypothetical protein
VTEISTSAAAADDDDPFYSYKARLAAPAMSLWLRPQGLEWESGRRSGLIRYDRIRRVRLSYRPATMQTHRFIAEIWSSGAPKLQVVSTSWQGITMLARQDAPYTAFITELHWRIAATTAKPRLDCGMAMPIYALGVAVIAATLVAFVMLTVKIFVIGDWRAVAVMAALFAVFAWQFGNSFARNRPAPYRLDAIPPRVLPQP